MEEKIETKGWLEYCYSCKRKHIMVMKPCPSCGVYYTPQPKGKWVYENCGNLYYECEGCDAYRDHLY